MDAQYCDLTKQGFKLWRSLLACAPTFMRLTFFAFGRTSFERYTLAVHRGGIATKSDKDAYEQDHKHAIFRNGAQSAVREIKTTVMAKQTFSLNDRRSRST